jgi:hypothetical protein
MSNLPRQYFDRLMSQTPNVIRLDFSSIFIFVFVFVQAAIWSSILSVGVNLSEIFVSQSARININGEHAIQQFLQVYPRSRSLTNSLLVFSGLSGVLAFNRTKDKNWLIGVVLMIRKEKSFLHFRFEFCRFSVGIPYGAFLEGPIVDQLKYLTLDARSEKVRSLFSTWGRFQCGKLSLALGGATIFYWLTRR